jgi:ComF family protein
VPCVGKARLAKQICVECAKPAVDGMTHIACKRAWGLSGCLSVWKYEGAIRKALLKLKYNFAKEIAEELSIHIVHYLQKEITALPKNSLLVPIPLHRRRTNWRGFNQGEEIGKLVAKRMGWKFYPDVLIRKLSKRPQTELKGDERRENILGVFVLNSDFKSLVISYQSLVIFDDVLTTGATMKEAAKVLKRNGAKNVWGLTIAK